MRHGLIGGLLALAITAGGAHAAMQRWWRAALWTVALVGTFVCVRFSVWLLPAVFAVHLAGAIDAFVVAYRSTEPFENAQSRIAIVVVVTFVASIVLALGLRTFVIEAFNIPSSAMYPTLQIGDHLFVRKTKSADRGDLVVFKYPCDPDRDYVKRLIAKGGDTVEVRCSVVYVNGKPLPVELVAAHATYRDRDEMSGTWSTREVSRYREHLDGRTYELFRGVDPESAARADFPRPDEPPRCMQGDWNDRGKVVATKQDAEPCEPQLHYVVPADHFFVMGDSRNNSNDSRIWGSVPASYLRGTVIGIWYSNGADGRTFSRFGDVE